MHEVEVSAFLLSKYEMTQEQWERMSGSDPSRWTRKTPSYWFKGGNPVEQVSWYDCMTLLPMGALELPTEAQWEYGCRAGTETPRPFAYEDFPTHANIGDQAYGRAFVGPVKVEAWDDGLKVHAPVGSLQPNAFGLHDVLGNVWEWCVDGYDASFYGSSPRVDPVVPFTLSATRVPRGGGLGDAAVRAHSASRDGYLPSYADVHLGVRPARAIDP